MDDSKIYIKQCEKAFKDIGIVDSSGLPNKFILEGYTFLLSDDKPFHVILGQVYRQDQLQEMVKGIDNEYHLLRCFFEFCSCQNHKPFEQLWLAFVMKEKYNKVWNMEEWRDCD